MKKCKWHIPAIIGAAIVIILIMILAAPNRCRLSAESSVEIPKGSSVFEIADILHDNGVISQKSSFICRTVLSGKKGELKYGKFTFKPYSGYGDIIKTLSAEGARRETVIVTIPEGYSAEMIIAELVEAGIGSENGFNKALAAEYDFEFLKYVQPKSGVKYRLQGYLFPSTYEFYTDESPENVIKIMLGEFEKQYKSVASDYADIDAVITKAALIEREARLDSERKTIAGVIENRIKAGMKLQIDASVVYAISDGLYNVGRVLYEDLEVDSPYNTYKYEGLPVGPICNPGIESVKAALDPEEHSWLYYRTDSTRNDGSHTFSETFEEHKNKR